MTAGRVCSECGKVIPLHRMRSLTCSHRCKLDRTKRVLHGMPSPVFGELATVETPLAEGHQEVTRPAPRQQAEKKTPAPASAPVERLFFGVKKHSRSCHDCGKPTTQYRCAGCWGKLRRKHGISAEAVEA